jgi:rod shape-determining protein MreC
VSYWYLPNSPYSQYSLQTLSYPLLRSIGTANHFLHGFCEPFSNIKNWFSSRSTLNQRLKKLEEVEAELVQAKLELATSQKMLKQLEPLTNFEAPKGFSRATVRVYGSPIGFYDAQLITAAPDSVVIKKDDIAVNEKGLVGRVIESSNWILRIMLITDMASRVPVKILETGENAIIVGNGTPTMLLEHLQSREMITNSYKRPPEVGDVLVTSGVGEIFPPDILVGVVAAIKDEEITVKPFVTFHICETVSILYGHMAS